MNARVVLWVTLLILDGMFSQPSASAASNSTQIVVTNASRTLGSNTASVSEVLPERTNQSATYEVSDEETGTMLILQFSSKPTAEEVEQAFSAYYRDHPEARSNKPPALVIPNTNGPPPFPTEFTNRAGVIFRNVKVQQAYSDGIVVSCTNPKNVWSLEKINFQELSTEIQQYYGYDPNNPAAFEARQRQLRDHNNAIWERQREADLRKQERDQAAGRRYFEDTKIKAEQGDMIAQYNLGACYSNGDGVAQDTVEAVKWLRKAAEQGLADAQRIIGWRYNTGQGVVKDVMEAVRWYRAAAEQNDAMSQDALGVSYCYGEGVVKDEVEGYKWFLLAAAQGNENAKKNIAIVERQLLREQIAEGQKLARNFRPQNKSKSMTTSDDEFSNAQPMGSGTGFLISEDGFIISNAHVVRGAGQVRVVTSSGLISSQVVKVDTANDLALLKAEGKFSALPVVASRGVKLGGTVTTVGFPNIGLQGFAPKLAKGEIAALSGAGDDARYFQISVPVQPGNSGGALVDERGNVVGVVSAKLNASAALRFSGALPENVNYAIKSSYLLSFLESVPEVAAKLEEPQTKEKKFEDVVKEAEQAAVLVLVY